MYVIKIIDTMDYVNDGKHPFVSKILKCNHIIKFGIKKNKRDIIALCLHILNINGHPHEVLVTKTVHEGNVNRLLTRIKQSQGSLGIVGFLLKLQK